jgi:hypothetical protein
MAILQSCTKEYVYPEHETLENGKTFSSARVAPSITNVKVVGQVHHAGEWIEIKWTSTNIPPLYSIFVIIGNKNVGGFGLLPAQPVRVYAWATANTGEAVFQITPDDGSGLNLLYYGDGSYGDGFTVTVDAVLIHPDGSYGGTDQQFESTSKPFTVLRAGCSSSVGYSTTDGQSCNIPNH